MKLDKLESALARGDVLLASRELQDVYANLNSLDGDRHTELAELESIYLTLVRSVYARTGVA